MKQPIVITAVGTTTKAQQTYRLLHTKLQKLLPGREIFWAYSSKMITKTLQDKGDAVRNPEELLRAPAEKGHKSAIVQSLHLFPGTEFHGLHHITSTSPLSCKVGLPLLSSPVDYQAITDLLKSTIAYRPERTILVLGHGKTHPSWTGYYSLEKILRRNFGDRIHVGVVEHIPDTSTVNEEISETPHRGVTIIPFFLICGMHYRRDIVSDDAHSWLSQLKAKNLDVEVLDEGVGMLPGLENLLFRHIEDAEKNIR